MTTVHIEFQRVQSWLFSTPRLRAMVGANTLLGEVLRVDLPDLARKPGSWSLASVATGYPAADSADPLKDHDDPAADARRGILSRDGGHFEAVFSAGAKEFASAAMEELSRKLPGLRLRISIDRKEVVQTTVDLSTELPVLARCEWTGRGLASEQVWQGDEPAEVTVEVAERHKAGRAGNRQARDLASLLIACSKLKDLRRPQTFEELAGDGYLVVIHADGNNVGRSAGPDVARRAEFFHRNRVLLRRALRFAIDRACEGAIVAPLLPLMLGGDDLLVVGRAKSALPFVVDLCKELERLQSGGRDGLFHLTLGVGVVFAKPTIPFHRLHEVAENLAASAKRRFRGFGEQERASVVDWAVYTTAWVDDPEGIRRRDWVRGTGENARILSMRPMRVLGAGLSSVEGLIGGSAKLSGAPRSQLRYLVDQLQRGKTLSELAFAELSKKALEALNRAGTSDLWSRDKSAGPYSTSVLDLVEVFEIENLGRAGSARPRGQTDEAGKHREEADARS